MSEVIGILFFALLVADLVVFYRDPAWIETWEFYYGICYISFGVLMASWLLAHQEWFGAVIFSISAAWMGITWWNRTKRRRKKLADKAAGVVVDVGGRLKVVREPIPER